MKNMLLIVPKLNEDDIKHISWWIHNRERKHWEFRYIERLFDKTDIAFVSQDFIIDCAVRYFEEWKKDADIMGRSSTSDTYTKLVKLMAEEVSDAVGAIPDCA